jgi:hypothetical protein
MEKTCSSKSNSLLASQEIPSSLSQTRFHFRVHNISQMDLILGLIPDNLKEKQTNNFKTGLM